MSTKKSFLSPSTKENLRIYRYKFSRNKLSVFGLILVCVSIFFAILAEVIVPYPESIGSFVDYANASLPPSAEHWFGTDQVGRDVFSRVIFSFRGALIMSLVVLVISVPVGTILGLIAGYYHGTKIDAVIMRISDVFLSVPSLILALCIASILEPNMMNSMLAVTIMWWPWYTRLVYGQASSISEEYFVKNAELIGASNGVGCWLGYPDGCILKLRWPRRTASDSGFWTDDLRWRVSDARYLVADNFPGCWYCFHDSWI